VLRWLGNVVKQVMQCFQTRHPFVRTALPNQSYLWQCGQWRSLEINPRLSTCKENVRMAVAQTEVKLPKFLERKRRRPRRAIREASGSLWARDGQRKRSPIRLDWG